MVTTTQRETILSYYAMPGLMSDAGDYASLLRELPREVPALVSVLQGLALHIFWAQRYGVNHSDERQAEVQIRPVKRKLARLLELDPRPLSEARELERRLVCNCRDFSLLLAAMLKLHGIPARARCGFGTYFIPNHFEDHWMTEYWKEDLALPEGGRWVQVDAQLDFLQVETMGIQFSPLDMPPGQFVLAGEAWQMCRTGNANPDDFGIFDYHGWDFIKGNLMRDLLALNRVEVLPWDDWGMTQVAVADFTPAQVALMDRVAALTLQGNAAFEEVRAIYEENPSFHIPEDWAN